MDDAYSVFVFQGKACVVLTQWVGSLEIGRQDDGEPEPYRSQQMAPGNLRRLIIAPRADVSMSRRQLCLDAVSRTKIRAENISTTRSIGLEGDGELPPRSPAELSLPACMTIGDHTLLIEPVRPDVIYPTLALPSEPAAPSTEDALTLSSEVGTNTIVDWLMNALSLLRSPTRTEAFFEQAARAVVQVGRLDVGAFLFWHEPDWQILASHRSVDDSTRWRPSRSVLGSLCEKKRTLWERPAATTSRTETLWGVSLAMAAPILDPRGELIGALYGERRGEYGDGEVHRVAATTVDLLASTVAEAIERRKQEDAAMTARHRFEEFFTPQLADQLDLQPDLLEDRLVEVSVLFVDIRDFSRFSERLDPATLARWLRETLTTLSDCVIANDGVLVDYVGDEILAMWGAPEQQSDHAIRACRTALSMLDALPELNRRLRTFADAEVQLGIGINTGTANVGQVGSDRKFKYGPLGKAVNLASRVQGVTKHLTSDLVVTRSTLNQLGSEFFSRRLCRIRVANIEEPVEIFELAREGAPKLAGIRDPYETALRAFEEGHYPEAVKKLGEVLAREPTDGPALMLMSRAVRSLTENRGPADPIWEVPGK